MPDSSQIDVVRRYYSAKGDPQVIRSVVASGAEWDVVEGFPNGGVYRGLDSILGDFFEFLAHFTEFQVVSEEFFEDGGHVIVLGRYEGITTAGTAVTSRFAHVFTLRDSRIVRLQQTCDTLPIARALGH
ncbi:nuclear transport factor 2 family protein [Streptomyces sp. MMG1121]|uniref:nuclear transport factor 2 family protein n=1 Tax=Streptomyces sp. MMG1121 TaxID=1415544 RepID=UPI0006AFF22B|nr:nuclear transport factor 2 family protein [Streptomyces sp. MMG1121]